MSLVGNRGVRTAAVRQTRVICRHSLLFLYAEGWQKESPKHVHFVASQRWHLLDQDGDVGITTLPSSGTAALTNPIYSLDVASVA